MAQKEGTIGSFFTFMFDNFVVHVHYCTETLILIFVL